MKTLEPADWQYARLISDILCDGQRVLTRGHFCRRLFARQAVFHRVPLIVARKTAWRNSLREMEWVLSGSSSLRDLHPSVHHWWEPWANEESVVSNNYGKQFRHFGNDFDQLGYLLDGVRNHPFSRRTLMTTWNTEEMADASTPITNCWGTVIQAFVDGDNALHLVTYQRSADVVCGLPSNWLQMWGFLLWLAMQAGRGIGSLTWIGGDVHVYEAHLDLAACILDTATWQGDSPGLEYGGKVGDPFRADDFRLDGEYRPVLLDRAEMIV